MNVTVAFTDAQTPPSPPIVLKIALPRKWLEGPVLKVKEFFCKQYAAKHPDHPLDASQLRLITPSGRALADAEPVAMAISSNDKLVIERGTPPTQAPSTTNKASEDNVTTREAIENTVAKAQRAFDHSKWDRLDLSDDDGADCHPNIELASWKRIRAQQRAQRREQEEAQIAALREEIAEFEVQAAKFQQQCLDPAVTPEAKKEFSLKHADALANSRKTSAKLQKFLETRKIVADEVCSTAEDKSIVNTKPSEPPVVPPNVVGPVKPDADFEGYDAYVERNEKLLRAFAAIDNDLAASETFLTEHPELLCQHADGFLLLLCLDTAMRHEGEAAALADKGQTLPEKRRRQNRKELMRVVRQHLVVNYILELAKVSNQPDPRATVRPFFFKTSKQSKDQAAEFQKELDAFTTRIEKRALDKLAAGERSPFDRKKVVEEPEYEPADVGPGGLDPNEVLPTLPKEMQEAFVQQDVDKLKKILSAMPQEEASYHLDRCIASGLWVVPQTRKGANGAAEPDADLEDDEDDDDDNHNEQQQRDVAPAVAEAAKM